MIAFFFLIYFLFQNTKYKLTINENLPRETMMAIATTMTKMMRYHLKLIRPMPRDQVPVAFCLSKLWNSITKRFFGLLHRTIPLDGELVIQLVGDSLAARPIPSPVPVLPHPLMTRCTYRCLHQHHSVHRLLTTAGCVSIAASTVSTCLTVALR